MSLTTAFSTAGPTNVTSPLALTTPFVQAPTCTDIFTSTSLISNFFWSNYSSTTVQVLVSDVKDPRFAACQPSGWANHLPGSRFSFSPAVCPSEWTTYALQSTEAKVATAFCCSRGYKLDWLINSLSLPGIVSPACFKDISATTAPNPNPKSFESGMQVHNAWHITWAASDIATLSPPPPVLNCRELMRTWSPGDTVAPNSCHDSYHDNLPWSTSLFFFLTIGTPLIFLALLALCCAICIYHRRRSRILCTTTAAQK